MTGEALRIVRLVITNTQRISAVDIIPRSDVVEITGRNGQGKTSVLNAIAAAIGGKRAIMEDPIHDGADKAEIRMDLGKYRIIRTIKRREGDEPAVTLRLENADGSVFDRPQNALASLFDQISFSPEAMISMKEDERYDVLRSLIPDYDFAAHDASQERDFAARRDLNRRAATAATQANGIQVAPGTPDTAVDVSAILAQLERVNAVNAEASQINQNHRSRTLELDADEEACAVESDLLDDWRRQLAARQRKLVERREQIERDRAALGPAPAFQPVDTDEMIQKIRTASDINAAVERLQKRRALEREAKEAAEKADELTAAMDHRERAKDAAIARAELPIEGLSVKDGKVLINGHPWSSASKAEQIRASFALGAARRKDIAVALIRDGAVIDQDGWRIIEEMAAKFGVQVWIETVESDRPNAIVIEDGRVRP